jgi:predicted nuclease of predicted toxin-antitoxin system
VRIKLDENLSVRVAAVFRAAGHDVDTVVDEQLTGAADRAVLHAATNAGRLVVTLDRGFGDVRSYPPGSHPGVLVLRVEDQSPPAVERDVRDCCTVG